MSRSPRAEALHMMRAETAIEPPELPAHLTPNSPEALAYIDSFKEAHFVALAHVTDLMLQTALANREAQETPQIDNRDPERWKQLANCWQAALREAHTSIQPTQAFDVASQFAQVTGTLNTRRHIALNIKLEAGSGTAIITTLNMLRNLPHIIHHHAGEETPLDPGAVARHPRSTGLVRRLAKQSVNQTLAAQTALAGRCQAVSWMSLDHTLRPEHFKLDHHQDGLASLSYADFDRLEVPAGYKPHTPFPPTKQATLIKDIPSEQSKTIGCPVTLLQGRMAEVWHWGIDLVEANNMWEERWPLDEGLAS